MNHIFREKFGYNQFWYSWQFCWSYLIMNIWILLYSHLFFRLFLLYNLFCSPHLYRRTTCSCSSSVSLFFTDSAVTLKVKLKWLQDVFDHMHAPCFAKKVLSLGDGHVSSICVMDWETKDFFQFCHPQCICISIHFHRKRHILAWNTNTNLITTWFYV